MANTVFVRMMVAARRKEPETEKFESCRNGSFVARPEYVRLTFEK
jgi:hypothetical protein